MRNFSLIWCCDHVPSGKVSLRWCASYNNLSYQRGKIKKKRPQNLWPWISSLISDFRYKYYQAERTFLPFALLAARTFLPPFVLILDLKPWTLALEIFLGWNVILLITVFLSANRDFCNYSASPVIWSDERISSGRWTFTSFQTCPIIIRGSIFYVK